MRILAFAYACEPAKGSEPGAGWGMARMLTELCETWVITRANNRESIEEALMSLPEASRLQFVYVDLPPWARWWKRGQRGARLYYILWLAAALRRSRRLHREVGFDLVWHLTLANAWLGTTASLVGPRFIYGPVGGGVGVPWGLLPSLGFRGALYEMGRATARASGRYANPLARLAWRRAEGVLVQNPETKEGLPRRHRHKAIVVPNAAAMDGSEFEQRAERLARNPSVALFAGRLLAFKGLSLALRAIARVPNWRLIVLGSGPDEPRLRRLARRLGLEERVEFRGWRPRQEVLRAMYEESHVFLFPSLHDEAPLVVAEALLAGLTLVCFDHGGPPQVATAFGAESLHEEALSELTQSLSLVAGIRASAFTLAHEVQSARRPSVADVVRSWGRR